MQCVLSLNPYNLLTSLRSVSLTDGLYKTSEHKKTQVLAHSGQHGRSLRTVGSKGQCLMQQVPITIYFISTKLFSKNFYTYFVSVCTLKSEANLWEFIFFSTIWVLGIELESALSHLSSPTQIIIHTCECTVPWYV